MARPRLYKEGEILKLMVQGIEYSTPPIPHKSKIKGSHLKAEDQVWYRDEEYLTWDWNIDPKEGELWYKRPSKGQVEWYEQEIYRINNGEWVMINGVPTFFNKYCYFFHNWFVLLIEQTYPVYKDTSLDYFTFFVICEDDPMCLGDCGIKGRRVGLSSMSSSVKLQIGLIEDNTLQGLVSKTGVDAQEMYFMVKNGLENLPLFIVPELNKVNDSEIHIARPAKKISINNKTINADKGKNNRINWLDTADNAYDGRNIRHVTVDEASKWVKNNVQKCLSAIAETLVVGASVSGHVSLFSTVNKGDKGGDNFRAIWDGSDHISGKKDMFGRTATKMKRFFISGDRGFMGYIGKYGESIVGEPTKQQTHWMATNKNPKTGKLYCPNSLIGARQYHEESRKMYINDPEEYDEYVRKYPFEWQEVFKGANNVCCFDLEALNNQIEVIERELIEKGKKENGRRVSFCKEHENASASFVDDSAGFWYLLDLPKEPNMKVTINGVKCPNNTGYGVAGLDPIASVKVTVDKGSDACIMIHSRFNALDPENSGMPVAMFIGRPKTKKMFHEQLYWGLEYYGIRLLGESAPMDWIDYAVDNRLCSPQDFIKKIGYLITTMRSNKKEDYGASPQSKDISEQHLTEMIEYSQYDMKKIRFIRLLRDMLKFDPKERTVFDACMAWGYALIGLKDRYVKVAEVKKIKKFVEIKHSKSYY